MRVNTYITMTRKMLRNGHYTNILQTAHVLNTIKRNLMFIFSERTIIDHWIIRIIIDVNHRCIINMNAHSFTLFADDPGRGERLALEAVGIYLDYSKNRVTDETLQLLRRLA